MAYVMNWQSASHALLNTLRPKKIFAILQTTFLNSFPLIKSCYILVRIALKVSKGPINNKPAGAQIMAWRRTGDEPLSEPMMLYLFYQQILWYKDISVQHYTICFVYCKCIEIITAIRNVIQHKHELAVYCPCYQLCATLLYEADSHMTWYHEIP